MPVSIFAADSRYYASKIDASQLQQAHDDTPTSALVLNYKWRRLLGGLLYQLSNENLYTGTASEIETAIDNVQKLVSGLYEP